MAHKFFCDLNGIEVYTIQYVLPFSVRADHVITSGHIDSKKKRLLIAIAPLVVNTLVFLVLIFPLKSLILVMQQNSGISERDALETLLGRNLSYSLLLWIGVCASLHALPSNQDMEEILACLQNKIIKILLRGLQELLNNELFRLGLMMLFSYALSKFVGFVCRVYIMAYSSFL